MRRIVVCGFIASVAFATQAGLMAAPPARITAQNAPGAVSGSVTDAQSNPLANVTVRIRRVGNNGGVGGTVVADVKSGQNGAFLASGLPAGSYVVEVVGANGAILAVSPTIAVAAGTTATIALSATTAGALAAAGGGGVSFLGLGTAATVGVLGAAAVGGFLAVKAVTNDTSPSR
jgi:hypothetical protein